MTLLNRLGTIRMMDWMSEQHNDWTKLGGHLGFGRNGHFWWEHQCLLPAQYFPVGVLWRVRAERRIAWRKNKGVPTKRFLAVTYRWASRTWSLPTTTCHTIWCILFAGTLRGNVVRSANGWVSLNHVIAHTSGINQYHDISYKLATISFPCFCFSFGLEWLGNEIQGQTLKNRRANTNGEVLCCNLYLLINPCRIQSDATSSYQYRGRSQTAWYGPVNREVDNSRTSTLNLGTVTVVHSIPVQLTLASSSRLSGLISLWMNPSVWMLSIASAVSAM